MIIFNKYIYKLCTIGGTSKRAYEVYGEKIQKIISLVLGIVVLLFGIALIIKGLFF